jgi:AcrR family transcriptional regulator
MAKGKRIDRRAHRTRTRLLDAAEEIVARDGVLALTFDRVAEQAGVAKGTVLYHFDCKEALTSAMIERFVERFDTAWADAISADPDPRGRAIRAYVNATHRGEPLTGRHFDHVNGAITAALANSPERLQPVQAQGERHQRAIEKDEIDPVLATIIRMAVDGLWFAESFNLMRYDPALKAAVIDRLIAWTEGRTAPAAPAAPEKLTTKATNSGRTK